MRRLIAVASREIAERRRFVVMAVVLLAVPFVVAAIPLVRRMWPWRDVLAVTAAALASLYALVVAIITGATIVVRDVGERRLSFYAARPLPARTIWFGKLIGGVFVANASTIIAALPVLFDERGVWFLAAAVAVATPLVFVGHCIAVAVRLPSRWLFADLAGVVVTAVLVAAIVRPLVANGARNVVIAECAVLATLLGACVVVAGWWQVRRGGDDPKRSHAAFSAALWTSVAVALAIDLALVEWVKRPSLDDCVIVTFDVPSTGDWIAVEGVSLARLDWYSTFYVNVRTRRVVRVARPFWIEQESLSSPDQRSAYWWQDGILKRVSLDDGSVEDVLRATRETNVIPSARTLAVVDDASIAFHSDGAWRRMIPNPLHTWFVAGVWIGPETVRLVRMGGDTVIVADVTTAGHVTSRSFPGSFRSMSPDERRAVTLRGTSDLLLVDLDSGEMHSLPIHDSKLLADGRVVQIYREGRTTWLDLFSASGGFLRRYDAGSGAAYVHGQPDRDRVVLGRKDLTSSILDLRSGAVTAYDLFPIAREMRYGPMIFVRPSGEVVVLENGRLVHLFDRGNRMTPLTMRLTRLSVLVH